ncbi:MAG: hypothetical protein AAFQ32_04620 [Pseudomonadota bacterium]
MIKLYFWNVLIALDQLLNALLGGDPDETVSSRAAKHSHKKHWHYLGLFLEFVDPGHMKRSLEADEGRRALYHEGVDK